MHSSDTAAQRYLICGSGCCDLNPAKTGCAAAAATSQLRRRDRGRRRHTRVCYGPAKAAVRAAHPQHQPAARHDVRRAAARTACLAAPVKPHSATQAKVQSALDLPGRRGGGGAACSAPGRGATGSAQRQAPPNAFRPGPSWDRGGKGCSQQSTRHPIAPEAMAGGRRPELAGAARSPLWRPGAVKGG